VADDPNKDDDGLLPPREGLIPGTWKYADASRLGGIVDRPRLPARWSARHVGMRMIEAHRILARVPMNIWPKQFGTAWPTVREEKKPLMEQASSGKERNRVQIGASADEIALMSEALSWPMQFLSSWAATAADINRWASQMTVEEFEKVDDGSADVPWDGLRTIAAALNAAGQVVR
jgi:hypothetical protein